jgi:hypothetical protein
MKTRTAAVDVDEHSFEHRDTIVMCGLECFQQLSLIVVLSDVGDIVTGYFACPGSFHQSAA